MKNKKRLFIIIAAVIIAILGICIGTGAFSKVNDAKEIAEALKPVLEAKNQSMNLKIDADINGTNILLDSNISLIQEKEVQYLVLEQEGSTFYIADNVLFLENGKAFKIADEMQTQTVSYKNLLPQISELYEIFEIAAAETENEKSYEISVTGEQVQMLLKAVQPAAAMAEIDLSMIETLQVKLITKEAVLERIELLGKANVESVSAEIGVIISEFKILEAGEYIIPDAVKNSAATVDKESLFSLTEDLYRLMLALEPFSDMENLNSTLKLAIDCGLLQTNMSLKLSDLKNGTGNSDIKINASDLEGLPEMLGMICMEGDISCTENNGVYSYKLVLDKDTMKKLVQMLVPSVAADTLNLTKGSTEILLIEKKITKMKLLIEGSINVVITEIPISVGAEFWFE